MFAAFFAKIGLKGLLLGGAVAAVIAFVTWDYFALKHRAEAIVQLTADKAAVSSDAVAKIGTAQTAAKDSAATLERTQADNQETINALKGERDQAQHDAALNAQIQERIKNAPPHSCIGPAMLAFIGSVRTDQLNSRSLAGSAAGGATAAGN